MRYFIWHCIIFHLQYIPICSNTVLQALDRLKILVRLDAWVWADLWMSQGGMDGAKWPRKLRTLSWLSRLELPGCLPENTGSGRARTSQERWGSGMQRMQTDAKTMTLYDFVIFVRLVLPFILLSSRLRRAACWTFCSVHIPRLASIPVHRLPILQWFYFFFRFPSAPVFHTPCAWANQRQATRTARHASVVESLKNPASASATLKIKSLPCHASCVLNPFEE